LVCAPRPTRGEIDGPARARCAQTKLARRGHATHEGVHGLAEVLALSRALGTRPAFFTIGAHHMSNRTKLAIGLYSFSLMACWLPPEFVREETRLFDAAVKDRDESALKQMCRNPHIESFANGYLHGGVIGQQDKACAELKKVLAGNETDRLTRAIAKGDTAVMLQMCRSPRTLDSQLTNAELGVEALQPQACAELKKATASNFEQVTKEATSLGGVPCLVRLEKHYDELKRSKTWLTETATDDGQRAAMKPHTDVCLGKLETDSKDGKHVAVYRELMAAKFPTELPSLMADQNARVRSVSNALRTAIATDYEAQAAALKDEPAAAALYLACAGKMALLAGDTARQGKDVGDAKALVTKAAIKESLTVSFAGDGLAAEVIARIKADGLGSGLEFATTGADIPVVVQLSTPSFQSTKEQVTLTTEVRSRRARAPATSGSSRARCAPPSSRSTSALKRAAPATARRTRTAAGLPRTTRTTPIVWSSSAASRRTSPPSRWSRSRTTARSSSSR